MAEPDTHAFLEKLGLTEYEPKTLNALFRLKESEAPTVSRMAQVPETRVYDVLDRLTKRGLIIEIYGRPKRYRAVEPENVFKSLIEDKKADLQNLESEASKIRGLIVGDIKKDSFEKVMKVKDKYDFVKILGQEIGSAKNSVVAFTQMGKEYSLLKEPLKNAYGKNVEIRLIGKITDECKKLAKEYDDIGIPIKDFEHGMHAYVVDGKKVILALSDFSQEKPEYHFTIWPNNKSMASALQNYFEQIWKKAK